MDRPSSVLLRRIQLANSSSPQAAFMSLASVRPDQPLRSISRVLKPF